MALRFYNINEKYLEYLHGFDKRVPWHNYSEHNKFYCGIVFQIGDFEYFSPVSSFKNKQKTNMLIEDNGEVKGSLRFCFMIPVVEGVFEERDFSKEEDKYKDLLEKEYKFCKENEQIILKKAKSVYKIGTSTNHPLKNTCCDFKKLELASLKYENAMVNKDIIVNKDEAILK